MVEVLIVDDRVSVRKTIKNMLIGFNCKFSEASNGEVALTLIKDNLYDVIFLDIKLPDISGITTLDKARQIQPNLGSVIILTGYPQEKTRIEAERLGAFAYLNKAPVKRDEIREIFAKASQTALTGVVPE
jgi:two-component system NtrC family response regulator/two-component system nitrogen regulation response regulator GlnG